MEKKNVTFASSDGRTTIHGIYWIPDGEIKGVLQLVHGTVQYIDRYDGFARYMNEQGFVVAGHDHLGHGDSVTDKSEWGVIRTKHPDDTLVSDIHTMREMIAKDYPGLPYFILGHSMGSYMLRKYLTLHSEGLSGAIIMGTGTESNVVISAGLAIVGLLGAIKGVDYRSAFVKKLQFAAPYQKYDVTGKTLNNSWLTKDEEIVEFYYSNPKCTYDFSVSGYKGLMSAVKYDNNMKYIGQINKDMPVLFVSGIDDPVGNFGKGVEAACTKFKAAGIKDVEMKLFENDRHEILNETDREQVYEDLYDWLDSKIK